MVEGALARDIFSTYLLHSTLFLFLSNIILEQD